MPPASTLGLPGSDVYQPPTWRRSQPLRFPLTFATGMWDTGMARVSPLHRTKFAVYDTHQKRAKYYNANSFTSGDQYAIEGLKCQRAKKKRKKKKMMKRFSLPNFHWPSLSPSPLPPPSSPSPLLFAVAILQALSVAGGTETNYPPNPHRLLPSITIVLSLTITLSGIRVPVINCGHAIAVIQIYRDPAGGQRRSAREFMPYNLTLEAF